MISFYASEFELHHVVGWFISKNRPTIQTLGQLHTSLAPRVKATMDHMLQLLDDIDHADPDEPDVMTTPYAYICALNRIAQTHGGFADVQEAHVAMMQCVLYRALIDSDNARVYLDITFQDMLQTIIQDLLSVCDVCLSPAPTYTPNTDIVSFLCTHFSWLDAARVLSVPSMLPMHKKCRSKIDKPSRVYR